VDVDVAIVLAGLRRVRRTDVAGTGALEVVASEQSILQGIIGRIDLRDAVTAWTADLDLERGGVAESGGLLHELMSGAVSNSELGQEASGREPGFPQQKAANPSPSSEREQVALEVDLAEMVVGS
jgi:hypothetical protein